MKFSITPETKKYLYIGGALIVAVVGGIYAYRHYQSNVSVADATAAQESQDQSALDELANAGYGSGDASSAGLGVASASPPALGDNFGQELTSLLQAAGLDQVSSSAPASPAPAATTTPAATSGGSAPSVSNPGSASTPVSSKLTTPSQVQPGPPQLNSGEYVELM